MLLKKSALVSFGEAYKKYLEADNGIINARFTSAFMNMATWRDVASACGASSDELSRVAEEVRAKYIRKIA